MRSGRNEIRLVCYPGIVGDNVKNFYGFFDVTFLNGKPVSATAVNMHVLPEVEAAIDKASEMWDTVFNHDTLLCLDTVNMEGFNGNLTFSTY